MPQDALPNGGALAERGMNPWARVAGMQAKLHRWAAADAGRRFDDLFNFVHDSSTLIVGFDRVAGNRGSRTPGVDGLTVADVEEQICRLARHQVDRIHGGSNAQPVCRNRPFPHFGTDQGSPDRSVTDCRRVPADGSNRILPMSGRPAWAAPYHMVDADLLPSRGRSP
jgi:hypothetical protein